MTTKEKALTNVSGTAIEAYGNQEEVREITDRLMSLHSAAPDVGLQGMRAVAQLAIMSGANPLPGAGEIYVWPGRDGRPVVDFGIAYYRRVASEKDTVIWVAGYEPRPMTAEERQEHKVPEDSLASICKGYCLSDYIRLLELNIPWQMAEKQLARTSTAVVERKEMLLTKNTKYGKVGDPVAPPKGRTWQWVCDKRAEKGLYRMKALVDTSLTDTMKARANQVLAQVKMERPPDAEVPPHIQQMSDEELNGILFDAEAPIEGEFEPVMDTEDDFIEPEDTEEEVEIIETEPEESAEPESDDGTDERQARIIAESDHRRSRGTGGG